MFEIQFGFDCIAVHVSYICSNSLCRNRRYDSDMAECESDSWSDDSWSDNMSRSLSNNSSRTWDAVSEDSSFDQEGSWPLREKLGYLSLQYMETSSPYWRVPFMDKVKSLVYCFKLTVL